MRAAGVTRVDSIRGLPLAVLEARPAQLAALLRSGLVEAVQEDVAVPPALAQSVALVDAPRAWAGGASGSGWAVAVLDSGVDATHPFLAGRVVAEACFSPTTSVSTSVCPNGQGEQVGPLPVPTARRPSPGASTAPTSPASPPTGTTRKAWG